MNKEKNTKQKKIAGEEFLEKLPYRPLTNLDLIKYIKLLKIPHFRGVFMRDNLPKRIRKNSECGIINLDNLVGSGTHWTCFHKRDSIVYYYDPFGNLRPCVEFIKYFNSNGICKIKYNHDSHQTYNTVNCGHLCLRFLYNLSK